MLSHGSVLKSVWTRTRRLFFVSVSWSGNGVVIAEKMHDPGTPHLSVCSCQVKTHCRCPTTSLLQWVIVSASCGYYSPV